VQYLAPQPISGALKLWREVYFTWSEKEPPWPYQVKLYDTEGLVRVVADVGNYQPIAGTGGEGGPQPRYSAVGDPGLCPAMMPARIRLSWQAIPGVQKSAGLELRLSEMSAKDVGNAVFRFKPPDVEIEQVDEGVSVRGSVGP
jgi:hypothetical protein